MTILFRIRQFIHRWQGKYNKVLKRYYKWTAVFLLYSQLKGKICFESQFLLGFTMPSFKHRKQLIIGLCDLID